MHLTRKEIFWKCWLWSIICGIVVAVTFWQITRIGGLFRGEFGGTIFLDILLVLNILSCDFGAGFVGWRIMDRYYRSLTRRFIRRYTFYCTIALVVLGVIIFSPLSILALLWSFMAPLCVLLALRDVKVLPRN